MSDLKTESISFKSSNGKDTIAGYIYTMPDIAPKAILQISHGMCEHIERYREFAEFMAQHGFVICGNDHLGHGKTSGEEGIDGYFGEKDGRFYVLRDLHTMNLLARKKYPDLPLILLGHSMGSFFARWFAAEYPDAMDALIISGTGGPNPLVNAGIGISGWISSVKGNTFTSKLVNRLAFGTYLKKVPKPRTPYDWISRDEQIVDRYSADPKCTFVFTVSAFHELFSTLKQVSNLQWAQKIRRDLPIWLFSGDMDPVGDYGKGVKKVAEMLRQAGIKDVRLTLYPGGRHEMLNETNRQQVYQDLLAWAEKSLERKE